MDICVIDDNPVVASAVKSLVVRAGLGDPTVFNDSSTALAWCQAHSPSLILLDYNMPVMDGLEFLRGLRTDPRSAESVVVVITGWATESFRVRALEAGASEVIAKPLKPLEFERKLRALNGEAQGRPARLLFSPGMDGLPAALGAPVGEGETVSVIGGAPEKGVAPNLSQLIQEYTRINSRWLCTDRELVRRCMLACARVYGLDVAAREQLETALDLFAELPVPLGRGAPASRAKQIERARLVDLALSGLRMTVGDPPDALQVCAQMVLFSQENWDGQGLPLGLRGAAIPFAARLFNVVNSFGLLALPLSRGGAGVEIPRALRILEAQSDIDFEPALVSILREIDPELLQIAR